MKQRCLLLGALLTAALLAACGGSRFSPSMPASASLGMRSHDASAATSTYELLYSFQGTPDGASPLAGLIALHGKMYGTTLNGSKNYCSQSCGSNDCYLGCGTVFSVDASGKEHVVYNFNGNFNNAQDGAWPFAGLTELKGALYGTTSGGGLGYGTVYAVTTSGKEKVLYRFTGGADAEIPEATLIAVNGTLYGTSVYGGGSGCGGSGCGTVFQMSTAGKESVLYSFAGGSDGQRVYAGLAYLHGKLYGSTLEGGSGCGSTGCGTIFELSLSGKKRVLYGFSGSTDGAFPNGLTVVGNVLYGTAEGGGTKSSGTFFKMTKSGKEQTLYSFQDIPDGNLPGATLLYLKGNFYSTTVGGGTTGDGTVYEIGKTGSESVLYSFQGGADGNDPQAPVTALNGELYSTTYKGGGTGCSSNGCGTIFSVTP
jgi:uncharacterized repeat protein (TIGR03803 family)